MGHQGCLRWPQLFMSRTLETRQGKHQISRPYWCDMIESVHVVFFLTCICTAERFSISCFFLFVVEHKRSQQGANPLLRASGAAGLVVMNSLLSMLDVCHVAFIFPSILAL